jgi:hypothetical protein
VIEMDATPVDEASKVLHPVARTEVSMRMASGVAGEQQLAARMDHLKGTVPHGAHVTVERIEVGQPFRARSGSQSPRRLTSVTSRPNAACRAKSEGGDPPSHSRSRRMQGKIDEGSP